MSFFLRRPFHPANTREPKATWVVTLFTMLLSGFVAYELCSEWPAAKSVFLTPRGLIAGWLGLPESNGWVGGFWMLFLFPTLLWTLLGSMVLVARGARSLGGAWRSLVPPLIPVIAAGHMAKGLAKISSWGEYLPLAIDEPKGVSHAQAITSKALALPEHLLSKPVPAILALGLVALFAAFALRENRLSDNSTRRSRIAPIVAIIAVELYLVWGWGFGG